MRSSPRSSGPTASATSSSTSTRPRSRPSARASSFRFDGKVRTGVRHDTYADVPTGEIGLVVDSYGLVSLATNRTSASEELRIGTGDEVILAAIGDEPVRAGIITPVSLKEKP
ncbi:SAM hydroxide adenosyltransferase [Aquihabitans daechungensis]|uniref:SAM hydroxide adenosyltransferase n=1 Tax=Aquihabitans daechungensis TaxID=1052257 RepID=UPI003BA0950E